MRRPPSLSQSATTDAYDPAQLRTSNGGQVKDFELRQVYDIAHNMAKVEEHEIEGRRFRGLRTPQRLDSGIRTRV